MFRLFHIHVPKPVFALALVDSLILYAAVELGFLISYVSYGSLERGLQGASGLGVNDAVFIAAVFFSAVMMGLYQRQFIIDLKIAAIRLMAANALAFFMLSIVVYLVPSLRIWMSALLPALGIAFIFMLAARVVFLRVADIERFKRRILVVGADAQAMEIAKLEDTGSFRCVGFIPIGDGPIHVPDHRLLRRKNDLLGEFQSQDVDEIVVAMSERRGVLPTDDLLACRLKGILVNDFWTFMERERGQVEVAALKPSWMIFAEGFTSTTRFQRMTKRFFDIVVSLMLLVFTTPVTIITAIFIYVQDRGPVFYRQERVGLYGETFFLMKFRSMRTDAEKDGVAQWAQAKDPRVTALGSFIRLTRIDEIPQVINVLKGEMSFIGPRPERPTIVEDLAKHIEYYHYRDTVKPGITGWAQINYPYGASVEDALQKLKYDLYYIKNYSLVLDFLILLQTVRVVLWPQGVR
ncbi:MAG: TIGR03013 family PEP-CTERM/XrtA system glycosyltransferase [Rhodospirillaceae bacterium]|nr:TIGR03013 family PEP-CTERM/XrtA system glycosyltransferase [Rhodospirillaceae bacterium]